MKDEYTVEVDKIERQIYDLVGKEFNLNSPAQLGEILFVDLKLPTKGIKKTLRGYSTGARELEKLKDLHPLARYGGWGRTNTHDFYAECNGDGETIFIEPKFAEYSGADGRRQENTGGICGARRQGVGVGRLFAI